MNDERTSVPMSDDTPLDQAVPSKSKYLNKDDVGTGIVVQIFNMTTDQVEGDNGVIEERAVLHFHGDVKPFILNQANKELLKMITGATTVGGVRNHQVILYNDPSIMYGRKLTGGVRMRSPQEQAGYPPPPQAPIPGPQAPAQVATPPSGTPFPNGDPNDEIPY